MKSVRRFGIFAWAALMAVATLALVFAGAKSDLGSGEARTLLAKVAGIDLKRRDVKIKSISSLGSSAVVEAQIETAFRFSKGESGKWRVTEIRTGQDRWESIELIARALDREKAERARAELEALATALEAFRLQRGFYVVSDNHSTLVDQLNPTYLSSVVRVDPWLRPYQYEGTKDWFILRSVGADGLANTPDDLIISSRRSP